MRLPKSKLGDFKGIKLPALAAPAAPGVPGAPGVPNAPDVPAFDLGTLDVPSFTLGEIPGLDLQALQADLQAGKLALADVTFPEGLTLGDFLLPRMSLGEVNAPRVDVNIQGPGTPTAPTVVRRPTNRPYTP